MFEFLKDAFNYEDRKVAKDEINGLIVSTAYTSDEGYETAIIDKNDTYPVERYGNIEDAKAGHKKWCEEAKTLKKVTKLGWLGLLPDEVVTIERE